MIVLTSSLLITVAGLLVYVLSSNPKVQELGKIAFAMGLLATLLLFGGLGPHVIVK